MTNFKLTSLFAVAILSGIAMVAFAEGAAPVYDADNYPPPQVDDQSAASSDSDYEEDAPVQQSSSVSSMTLQKKVSRLEQQLNNLKQSDFSARIEELQNEVQSLRGQIENVSHQLDQVQNQQRALSVDVDKRLSSAEVTEKQAVDLKPKNPSKPLKSVKVNAVEVKETPVQETVAEDNQPNLEEEQQIYQTAYNNIKAKKYNEAIASLQTMLQKYPSGQFAAKAHYWLGELYGLLNKNDQSAAEFAIVLKNYPKSSKAADAQLNLGMILESQMHWSDAKANYKKVIDKYPGTPSAHLASTHLSQIKDK